MKFNFDLILYFNKLKKYYEIKFSKFINIENKKLD